MDTAQVETAPTAWNCPICGAGYPRPNPGHDCPNDKPPSNVWRALARLLGVRS